MSDAFEELFFKELEAESPADTRSSLLNKPNSLLTLVTILQKAKVELCSEGMESNFIDLSRVNGLDSSDVTVMQEDLFNRVETESFRKSLKGMIQNACKISGVESLDCMCLCGSSVRVPCIRRIIDEAAKEMHVRVLWVLGLVSEE